MSNNATGPRTDAGKARSSQNAVKHGLCSQRAVIPGEDAAEWDAFREEIVRSFAPATFLERELAERVALQMWRQRRAARYEAELVSAAYGDEPADGPESDDARPALPERAQLLKEAMKMLRECQAQRQASFAYRTETAAPQPNEPPAPDPQAADVPSSFGQVDAAARGLRRIRASLPHPGVSFADFDLVPKPPTAKT